MNPQHVKLAKLNTLIFDTKMCSSVPFSLRDFSKTSGDFRVKLCIRFEIDTNIMCAKFYPKISTRFRDISKLNNDGWTYFSKSSFVVSDIESQSWGWFPAKSITELDRYSIFLILALKFPSHEISKFLGINVLYLIQKNRCFSNPRDTRSRYWFLYLFKYILFKIHVRRAAAEDILKFTCICVCVYVFVCLCHVSWPH